MKRLRFGMSLLAIFLHLILIASVALPQGKNNGGTKRGVLQRDPNTGFYRVTPETKQQQMRNTGASAFDMQRFERELAFQKRFARQQEEMKKLFDARQNVNIEKQRKQRVQSPNLRKIKLFGRETEFYEGPPLSKRSPASHATAMSISNLLINGQQTDTIFANEPFTLSFSFAPNALSAVVRIYADMNHNGIIDSSDAAVVPNGLVLDDGDLDADPVAGSYSMHFKKGNLYSNIVATLLCEVDDFQSSSSATLVVNEHTSSKVIVGSIKPVFKNTVVAFGMNISGSTVYRYVFPDSMGTCIVHHDTTAYNNVGVFLGTTDHTPDGYIPPKDISLVINKDTNRFTLEYIAASEFIEGYVKDHHGDPIKDAIIEVPLNYVFVSAKTDSEGYYTVGVLKGTWNMYTFPPATSDQYMGKNNQDQIVKVNATETVRKDFVLPKASSTISGSVKYGGTGVGGVPVAVYGDSLYNRTLTGLNGNFTLKVYKPSIGNVYYTVSTIVDDYGYYVDSAYRSNVSPGAEGVGFELKKVTGGLQGKVSDINTGQPVKNAQINLSGPSYRYIQTNDSGYYKVSLQDGVYYLSLSAQYYDFYTAENIVISGSLGTKNILLTRTGSFSGTVVDENGDPIPFASVMARDSLGYYYGNGTSQNQGTYVVSGLMTSMYKAAANAVGFVPQWYDKKSVLDSATSFLVTKGFDTPEIDFVLSRGGSISGCVKDKNGNGIPEVGVYALDTVFNFISMTATDDSGNYVVSGLLTGKYYVVVDADSFLLQWYDGITDYHSAASVTVTLNQNTSGINFTLLKGAVIAGTVVEKGGNPIAGAEVVVVDSNYSTGKYVYTDDSGMYQITTVPILKKLFVTVRSEGYSQRWYDNVISLELATPLILQDEQRKENVDFILPIAGKISGIVKNKAGIPVQFVGIFVTQVNGGYSYYSNTDQFGNYLVGNLVPGNFIVSASNYEYITQWYNHKPSADLADTVVVEEEMTVPNINFDLSSGGKISGTIKNISGQPVLYGNIFAIQTNGINTFYANSDHMGNYTVSNVTPGSYYVTASHPEYIQQWYNHKTSMQLADTIVIEGDMTVSNVLFDLKPVPPPTYDSIVIKLTFANIPASFVFSKTGLPDYYVDYWWGFRMDVDNNPATGPQFTNGCEMELVAFHYKEPGEPEHTSTIIDGTHHVLIEWIGETDHWRHDNVVITLDNNDKNTLVMKASKDWVELNAITSSTKYYIHAFSQFGGVAGTDVTPLSSGFVQVTDPSGDAVFDYIDIVKATPSIVTTVGDMVRTTFPSSFSLAQNYPNPFNPSTNIRYGLPSSSRVSLKIYNILGQQVTDLVNTEQSAGWYETVWNANVASGLYFYRIDAVSTNDPNQRFTQLKKMLLLK